MKKYFYLKKKLLALFCGGFVLEALQSEAELILLIKFIADFTNIIYSSSYSKVVVLRLQNPSLTKLKK